MKDLNIVLKNCHGIRDLEATFTFAKGNAVAIYAPNGTMKTSFARTLADLSNGRETMDHMFPTRETMRSVTDEIMVEIQRLSQQEYVDVYASSVRARVPAKR